ncbi:MAG TPA: nucleotidyltransferase domain-containing protein, partial [Planctomycetota bacterium]|nr:nucleotidyltransferase domain-containing protein [Planctomycetota bacterium]
MNDKPRAELEKLGAPPEVSGALVTLCAELERLAGPNLHGVILYGGVARGRFTKGRSDVNVAVVLREASSASLAKIAPALRQAFRSMRVEPFLLTAEEVTRAADVFPTKLLDIRDHHVVLQGEDPFAGLEVEREHIRLRIEQELRNLALRLRRRFVSVWDSPDELAATLGEIAAPLSVELLALTKLAGKPLPADDSIEQTLAAAA